MAAAEELLRLEVEQTCNTADGEIISNLKATKYRPGTKWLDVETNLKDRPLVICGSGPSAWEALKGIKPGYDLMALNGAYNALRGIGHIPEYYMQLDARAFNVPFVARAHEKTKFLLAAQVHPDVFEALQGFDVTTYHLMTETSQVVFGGEQGTFMNCPAGTVGLCAMGMGAVLGYRTMILIGYDSSAKGDQSHMLDQPQNVGSAMFKVEFDGKWYVTTPTMAAQVQEFLPWNRLLHEWFSGLAIHAVGEGLLYDYVNAAMHVPTCTTTREEELARYTKIYEDDPDYHCTDIRLRGLEKVFRGIPTKGLRYLDVSCGRGESLALADKFDFEVVSGTETVGILTNERVGYGVLPNLSIPDKYYDVVSCIEVLEHLVPDDVTPALLELERIAKSYIIISAADFPSWYNGANLHPSARPEHEWHLLFVELWGDKVQRLPFNLHPSPAWLVKLC